MRRIFGLLCFAAATAGLPLGSAADIVCADSSYCVATFANPARDRILINPGWVGNTFANAGITIHVFLRNCQGQPLVGVPAAVVQLTSPGLCICPGGNLADAATDAAGHAQFTGTINAGGCVESLDVVADGVAIGSVPVKTNSHDILPASPCHIDAGDLAAVARALGSNRVSNPANYTICIDYNQDGFIDASDVANSPFGLSAACAAQP